MVEAFLAVLGVSATVGLVALALALLSRPLNRHAAARWKYWVWLVLAVRLLLPFDLALPASPARVELPAAMGQGTAGFTSSRARRTPRSWRQSSHSCRVAGALGGRAHRTARR